MKKYLKYLKYVLIHKWYVMVECFKIGEYWRGITHDLSKFLPDEFIPYARYFYGTYPNAEYCRRRWQVTMYYGKSDEQVKEDFNVA